MRFVHKVAFLLIFIFPASKGVAFGVVFSAEIRPATPALRFAQAEIDALSESDLRRLNFYTGRAVDALAALSLQDDAADGSANVGGMGQCRMAIQRLIDAGARSGLSQDTVANYFQTTVDQVFGQDTPLALQNAAGDADAKLLFSNVAAYFATQQAVAETGDIDYAAQIESAAAEIEPLVPGAGDSTPVSRTPPPNEAPTVAGPVIPDDADEATRAVLERVRVRGSDWVITSVLGDSLSSIAAAVYGDSLRYRDIYANNQDVLTDPNILEIDVTLVLPKTE